MPADTWNLLVVDDEPDVHEITNLALKHRQWRKRGFSVRSAMSAQEAIDLLKKDPSQFHVALVDVVMETDSAGLDLCKYIRLNCPPALRIVLRTGQPGVAPEEYVLNEYDIDYYLAKSEATPERLYSVARACLRSCQDISTLIAFGKQLQSFSRALQNVSTLDDLLVFMGEGLRFLELKHSVSTVFVHDSANNSAISGVTSLWDTPVAGARTARAMEISQAIRQAEEQKLPREQMHQGSGFGLGEGTFLITFQTQLEETPGRDLAPSAEYERAVNGGLFVEMRTDLMTEKTIRDFWADAMLFIDNWKIAYATLRLQERLARERLLREKMYYERLQSIATMVTGVAHELNTPLGVANTAGSMITNLAKTIATGAPGAAKTEAMSDLSSSCDLLLKNLARAHELVRSFKQLSASQLSDQRTECDVVGIVKDCLSAMTPETRKRKLKVNVHPPAGERAPWNGFPGHLSQVLINFIQNTLRYAYADNEEGTVDIRVQSFEHNGRDYYRLEYQDYGKGVAKEVAGRIFEPFVTTGRAKGGTGLGLAISQNIVTNLLKGRIDCQSEPGKGATFTVEIPKVVEDEKRGSTSLRASK